MENRANTECPNSESTNTAVSVSRAQTEGQLILEHVFLTRALMLPPSSSSWSLPLYDIWPRSLSILLDALGAVDWIATWYVAEIRTREEYIDVLVDLLQDVNDSLFLRLFAKLSVFEVWDHYSLFVVKKEVCCLFNYFSRNKYILMISWYRIKIDLRSRLRNIIFLCFAIIEDVFMIKNMYLKNNELAVKKIKYIKISLYFCKQICEY